MWLILAGVAVVALAGAVRGASVEVIEINQSRVMMTLVGRLQSQYRYLITYEDAPVDRRDLLVERRANGKDYLYPAWKPVVFHLDRERSPDQDPRIMEALMEEYRASGNPHRFRLVAEGAYTHIVPADGQPILSTPVDSSLSKGSCWDLLSGLLHELERTRSVKIAIARIPIFPMDDTQCAIAGHGLPARQVLIQLLDQIGNHSEFGFPNDRFGWSLVYEPTTEAYFLTTYLFPGVGQPPRMVDNFR